LGRIDHGPERDILILAIEPDPARAPRLHIRHGICPVVRQAGGGIKPGQRRVSGQHHVGCRCPGITPGVRTAQLDQPIVRRRHTAAVAPIAEVVTVRRALGVPVSGRRRLEHGQTGARGQWRNVGRRAPVYGAEAHQRAAARTARARAGVMPPAGAAATKMPTAVSMTGNSTWAAARIVLSTSGRFRPATADCSVEKSAPICCTMGCARLAAMPSTTCPAAMTIAFTSPVIVASCAVEMPVTVANCGRAPCRPLAIRDTSLTTTLVTVWMLAALQATRAATGTRATVRRRWRRFMVDTP